MRNKGITLIALVITIIVLLILAGITINLTLGENGILKKAEEAKEKENESSAREKLELVLLDANIEKQTNTNYTKESFLTQMLEDRNMTVDGDTVTVDNYVYKIDREKLEIIESLGESLIKLTSTVQEYLGANENGKYEVSILLTVESNTNLQSVVIEKPDGTTFEIIPEGKKVAKDLTVELDETYIVTATTKEGKTQTRKIIEKSEENIKTVEELVTFRDKVNSGLTYEGKTINVVKDLDLSSVCYKVDGTTTNDISWEPIGTTTNPFKGTFDGNKHIIDNLYINTTYDNQGLFGYAQNATITGVVIGEKSSLSANAYVGALIGISHNSTILKCGNYSNVVGKEKTVGGIIGVNKGIVEECYNKGIIKLNLNTAWGFAGGISGGNSTGDLRGIIRNCYNTGLVTGTNGAVAGGVSGFLGANPGEQEMCIIENCYNVGQVTSTKSAGGITGYNGNGGNNKGQIFNSYCKSTIATYSFYYWTGSKFVASTEGKVSDSVIKQSETILGTVFTTDMQDSEGNYLNNGYPILKWEVGE